MSRQLQLISFCHEDFSEVRRPMSEQQARTATDAAMAPPSVASCIPTDGGLRYTFRGYGGDTFHAYYRIA
jgi:hypothetical protein